MDWGQTLTAIAALIAGIATALVIALIFAPAETESERRHYRGED